MRIKIIMNTPVVFTSMIKVRISDINYGGHVGNDSILSIIHEARLAFLNQWGFTEMNAGGCGLIMADSAIQYKAESFYGDVIEVAISIDDIKTVSFDMYYKLQAKRENETKIIAMAKTGMITFDYHTRSIVTIPDLLKDKLVNGNVFAIQ